MDEDKKIECWSCHKIVSVKSVNYSDGYCPKCTSPIDLEEYED